MREAVNKMIKDETKVTAKDGRQFELEWFLGGDMKWLLIAMGLKPASCKKSCVFCK